MSDLQKLYDEVVVWDSRRRSLLMLWCAFLALIKILIYKLDGQS